MNNIDRARRIAALNYGEKMILALLDACDDARREWGVPIFDRLANDVRPSKRTRDRWASLLADHAQPLRAPVQIDSAVVGSPPVHAAHGPSMAADLRRELADEIHDRANRMMGAGGADGMHADTERRIYQLSGENMYEAADDFASATPPDVHTQPSPEGIEEALATCGVEERLRDALRGMLTLCDCKGSGVLTSLEYRRGKSEDESGYEPTKEDCARAECVAARAILAAPVASHKLGCSARRLRWPDGVLTTTIDESRCNCAEEPSQAIRRVKRATASFLYGIADELPPARMELLCEEVLAASGEIIAMVQAAPSATAEAAGSEDLASILDDDDLLELVGEGWQTVKSTVLHMDGKDRAIVTMNSVDFSQVEPPIAKMDLLLVRVYRKALRSPAAAPDHLTAIHSNLCYIACNLDGSAPPLHEKYRGPLRQVIEELASLRAQSPQPEAVAGEVAIRPCWICGEPIVAPSGYFRGTHGFRHADCDLSFRSPAPSSATGEVATLLALLDESTDLLDDLQSVSVEDGDTHAFDEACKRAVAWFDTHPEIKSGTMFSALSSAQPAPTLPEKPMLTEWRDADNGDRWRLFVATIADRKLAGMPPDCRVISGPVKGDATYSYLVFGEDAEILASDQWFATAAGSEGAASRAADEWYSMPETYHCSDQECRVGSRRVDKGLCRSCVAEGERRGKDAQ